jgi:ribosome recycling factor
MIKVPPLTEERRINVTKVVARDGEDAKIALRNKRHDARKHLDLQLKAEEISRDQKTGRERDIDEVVKKYNDEVDRMVKAKSEEVMKI